MKRLNYMSIAAIMGMFAVLIGAFAAHGLEARFDAKMLARFQTGVEYQFYHALALLLVGWILHFYPFKLLRWAGLCFLIGIILFSGSLYAYVLSGISKFGMITPFGGMLFIIGWLLAAIAVSRIKPKE